MVRITKLTFILVAVAVALTGFAPLAARYAPGVYYNPDKPRTLLLCGLQGFGPNDCHDQVEVVIEWPDGTTTAETRRLELPANAAIWLHSQYLRDTYEWYGVGGWPNSFNWRLNLCGVWYYADYLSLDEWRDAGGTSLTPDAVITCGGLP